MTFHTKKKHVCDIIEWRTQCIERIKRDHPIYESFEFEYCSDIKIAEMFQFLVLEDEQGEGNVSAQ